jgi:hypothetical protein
MPKKWQKRRSSLKSCFCGNLLKRLFFNGRDSQARTDDLCNVTVWYQVSELSINTITMKETKNQKYSFFGLLARF